jgi:hypothetical protein
MHSRQEYFREQFQAYIMIQEQFQAGIHVYEQEQLLVYSILKSRSRSRYTQRSRSCSMPMEQGGAIPVIF